ncbi:FecR domain-containing protein [Nannocystis sp. SCPEA4]|uniref:tetratricopeptide repeat protein n=1 Tax=Nannocystis sp. SCPEA4 TaxID=2996787 RepID=UPI0022716E91|nr:FecR domain-containing protein [Nannocystis sp. SCPEA4]MCY1057333.1 FecR domain-containing protein [Nannocystis sp. SCPEA4]
MTDPVQRLAREVARNLGDGPGPIRRERQRAAVARLTRAPRRAPRSAWWLVPLVAAAVVALLLARPTATSAPLTVAVAQQAVMVGSWLAAPEHEALVLEFSDRSRAELTAGTAARLVKVESTRVELHLERGAVALDVQPAPGREWFVIAGPFTVELSDAASSATWQPDTRTLIVEVRRGSAAIGGDAPPTRLTAGQRLELRDLPAGDDHRLASPGDAHAAIPSANNPPPPSPPAGDPSSPPTNKTPSTKPSPAATAKSPPSPRQPTWIELAEAGDHTAALAAAEQLGFGPLLKDLEVDDLDLLARCARFAGDGPRARDALQALRRRFPGDSRARTAAFLLGRVALDLEHDAARAGEWFATYLSEAPDGALAGDARRRLDELGPQK